MAGILRAVPRAELVFATVLDGRLYEAQGEGAPPLVHIHSLPGRGLPFAVIRDWKAPQGLVSEHFEFVAPSGNTTYVSEPRVRKMPGQMDLTRISDVVEDAVFRELGVHLASFAIAGEVQGQVEFQVMLQHAPTSLPKDVESELKASDVIWVGPESNGRDHAVPVWFVYRNGRIYTVTKLDEKADEQVVPGALDEPELVVIARHKGRDTRTRLFPAAVRIITGESPEFGELAALLADRRRDRHIPPAELVRKWQSSCAIVELTPTVPI